MNCGTAAPTSAVCAEESTSDVGARGRVRRFAAPGRLTVCSTTVDASPARRAVRDNPAKIVTAGLDAQRVTLAKRSTHRGVSVSYSSGSGF